MAIQLQPGERSIWRIVQAVMEVVSGRHNACGEITLTLNATQTVVVHPNCSEACEPQITAHSAAAAAALSTTFISAVNQGSFTLTHASSAAPGRTFGYTVTGG